MHYKTNQMCKISWKFLTILFKLFIAPGPIGESCNKLSKKDRSTAALVPYVTIGRNSPPVNKSSAGSEFWVSWYMSRLLPINILGFFFRVI